MGYEIVERIGQDLGLKIAWTEEVGSVSWLEGLQAGRYDLVCNPVPATTPRARRGLFSVPLFYTALNAYVRVDDGRFDHHLEAANDPGVTIAVVDGSTSASIAEADFPHARRSSLPDLTDFSQLLMEVSTGKADLTFSEASQFYQFNEHHPGVLRPVRLAHPVRLVQSSFCARIGEDKIIGMMNLALQNLQNSGFVDAVISKYEPAPGMWRRVALPYR